MEGAEFEIRAVRVPTYLSLNSSSVPHHCLPWSPASGSCVSGDDAVTTAGASGSFPPGSLCRAPGPPQTSALG